MLGGGGFPSPFNSGGDVEDGSGGVDVGSSLPTAAQVLHIADLGGGGFSSPFNFDGGVVAGSGLPTTTGSSMLWV